MAINIFIGSVFEELKEERKALQDEILRLHDLFIGMELFGSDPNKPIDYCIQKVLKADLYVGLFGLDYGSIEVESKKSFTELEYYAAFNENIPCLIYFKGYDHTNISKVSHPKLNALKDHLRQDHIVYTFKNINELKIQFLVDFIKLLRTTLFDKVIPLHEGSIPYEALYALTKGIINEQIKTIGHDKYIPAIYITREAEKKVDEFVGFETVFIEKVKEILGKLTSISKKWNLTNTTNHLLENLGEILKTTYNVSSTDIHIIDELTKAFYVKEVEILVKTINSIILEADISLAKRLFEQLHTKLKRLHFVDQTLLPSLKDDIFEFKRRMEVSNSVTIGGLAYRSLLAIFPSFIIKGIEDSNFKVYLVGELIVDLSNLIEYNSKRCCVLVDKAGTGKTNMLCHIAEELINGQPVLLLSGQIELSTEYDIESYVQQRLEIQFRGVFSDWMNRITTELLKNNKWLYIIIDGINENNNLSLFVKLLKNFLARIGDKRIKIIVSCRDLFWDLFQNIFDSYIFKDVITIDDFSETEWDKAITVYFERFNIKCVLNKDAKAALKNPLLLRFFCEANRNQNLGKVNDLKLLSVFDLYIKRINKNIVQTAGFLKPDSILNLLLTISYRMWKERTTNISLSTIDITSVQSSDRTSLYNMIVSENVLIEERINVYTSKKNIRFIYDEFMEYMLARSWMDEVYSSRNLQLAIETLIQEAVEVIETFSPAFGAILFFDQMLKSNGSLINKTIVLMWKLGKHSQQFQMLRAFESINYDELDNNLIKTLQEFESELKVELKERFSGVVLRVLGKIPSVEYGKSYINKVLEVDDETEEYDLLKQKANSERLTALEIKEIYKNDISEEDIPRLPPARFHYTEETKLNAIGLLVRLNDDYQTIEKGIKKLGRTDIHSALQALEWIDLGHDDLVYKAVNEYINLPVPEYRIFSAWLLRNRYGVEPANFLINLLLDQQTRVSQYTNTLFRFREIETELIQRIIEKIENYKEIKHWYLNPLIKLLGNRDQFKPTNINTKIISKVVSCLNILTNHNKSTTRLESYRALVKYLDIVHVDELTNRMFQDTDTYIKSEAEKIYSKFS